MINLWGVDGELRQCLRWLTVDVSELVLVSNGVESRGRRGHTIKRGDFISAQAVKCDLDSS